LPPNKNKCAWPWPLVDTGHCSSESLGYVLPAWALGASDQPVEFLTLDHRVFSLAAYANHSQLKYNARSRFPVTAESKAPTSRRTPKLAPARSNADGLRGDPHFEPNRADEKP
jgi:hypothetical protein